MSSGDARRFVVLAYFGMVGLVTVAELNSQHDFPRPQRYVNATVAYTMLGVLAEFAPELAVIMAVGLDLAIMMQPNLLTNTAGYLKNFVSKVGG